MFSNGSHITLNNARKSHDILKIIFPNDKVISVDDVQAYKPSRTAYNYLLESVGKTKSPQEVILISSNPFDICGAGAMGMKSVWINRSGAGWVDQLGDGPTYTAKAFSDLIKLDAMQSK
jgi:2-haloacid dehalogenase